MEILIVELERKRKSWFNEIFQVMVTKKSGFRQFMNNKQHRSDVTLLATQVDASDIASGNDDPELRAGFFHRIIRGHHYVFPRLPIDKGFVDLERYPHASLRWNTEVYGIFLSLGLEFKARSPPTAWSQASSAPGVPSGPF
jgi:hypothetical protein